MILMTRRRNPGAFERPFQQQLLLVLSLLVVALWTGEAAAAAASGTIACQDDQPFYCAEIVGPGSECIQGLCSNPFVSGCLRTALQAPPSSQQQSSGTNIEAEEGATNSTSTGTSSSSTDNTTTTTKSTINISQIPSTLRVCNSDDLPETILDGKCRPSPLEYMEIRILTGNWESSLLTAWALQILLSEWMDVPTSIESSDPNKKANFYNPINQFDYGAVAYDYTALEVAHQVGDCRNRNSTPIDVDKFNELFGGTLANSTIPEDDEEDVDQTHTYKQCAHIMPEVWNGQHDNIWRLVRDRIIESPEGNGVVGKLTWFIPKYTAEEFPELSHYSGWVRNATQVATTFFRPLTWKDYCESISLTQCESPDEVASRPPLSESEQALYYFDDEDTENNNVVEYMGYFQANNNAAGEFIDFPCDWSSFAVQQAYHLGIPIVSSGSKEPNGGYTYGEKLQILRAANATSNHVVMNWYLPDPTYQWYRGTNAELQEVQLPPPFPECVKNRVSAEDRCNADPTIRQGNPKGACGAEVQTLEKVVVANLYDIIYNQHHYYQKHKSKEGMVKDSGEDIDTSRNDADARRSPAYEAIKNFHISEFDIGEMFEHWRDRLRKRGHTGFSTFDGTTGADPRHVVCQWVQDNAEHLQTFIPFTYPRILEENSPYELAIFWVAMVYSILVVACIFVLGIVIYVLSDKPAFKIAQIPFLYMVWLGLLMISVGSMFYTFEPERGNCVARSWLITMGYTMELVPLLVKIGAINSMLQAAKRMRRVTIERNKLFGIVGGICLLTAAFLTAWTVVDPPTRGTTFTLQLDDDMMYEAAEEEKDASSTRAWWQPPATPVTVSYYCRSSGSSAWFTITMVWQCFLLLGAAVLAMQTRKMQKRWNESRSLAIMVYVQSCLVLLRFFLWLFESSSGISAHYIDLFRSFIFSTDAILASGIYFGSKLVKTYKKGNAPDFSGPSGRDFSDVYSNYSRNASRFDDNKERPSNASNYDSVHREIASIVKELPSEVNVRTPSVARSTVLTSLEAGDIIMSEDPTQQHNEIGNVEEPCSDMELSCDSESS